MRAYVTSIGEPTTELCVWSLERQGFTVTLIESATSLWDKLRQIFAEVDEDFVRVDADVICNRKVRKLITLDEAWWYQGLTYGWHQQDATHGGVQFIRKAALPAIREHILEAAPKERPESHLSRLAEFHNPRRFETFNELCGLHGYGQHDIERIKETKRRRNQYDNYDWELAERISELSS